MCEISQPYKHYLSLHFKYYHKVVHSHESYQILRATKQENGVKERKRK